MLHHLNDLVEQWVAQWGYFGIFAAMVLENVIPPIPSEVIMPLAGFYVGQGKLGFIGVVLAGLLGTVVGALPWYGIGRLVNEQRLKQWVERHGRWLGVSVQELDDSRHWFQRHGAAVVFWGRLIPAIRTLISVPAGIELMPFGPFLFWTTAGSLVWNVALTAAGWSLGSNWNQVLAWIKPVEG
ncbi:MAG: DedA family protein, partial [Vulcanococcus sp.]